MAVDMERFFQKIADYVVERIDEDRANGLGYKGLLPPISSRRDFENFPNSLFPLVGVAPGSRVYADQSIGRYYPTQEIQVLFSSRDSGIDPATSTADMLSFTQQIETILTDTIKNDRFGLPDVILAADLLNLVPLGSFYTQVERNRKSYNVAYFTVSLYLGGL